MKFKSMRQSFLYNFQEGNDIPKYNMYDEKLKRRPLMTLIVSVIGTHFDNPPREEVTPQHALPVIYEEHEDDPNPFYKRPSVVILEAVGLRN